MAQLSRVRCLAAMQAATYAGSHQHVHLEVDLPVRRTSVEPPGDDPVHQRRGAHGPQPRAQRWSAAFARHGFWFDTSPQRARDVLRGIDSARADDGGCATRRLHPTAVPNIEHVPQAQPPVHRRGIRDWTGCWRPGSDDGRGGVGAGVVDLQSRALGGRFHEGAGVFAVDDVRAGPQHPAVVVPVGCVGHDPRARRSRFAGDPVAIPVQLGVGVVDLRLPKCRYR